MSDEHILEGSDAAERPLLSYRQSWLAWAGPVLMLLVCVALCVAGQRYMPEFFWIFAGVGALLVLCMVYRVLLVRSVHLYADSKGVWLYHPALEPGRRGRQMAGHGRCGLHLGFQQLAVQQLHRAGGQPFFAAKRDPGAQYRQRTRSREPAQRAAGTFLRSCRPA